MSKRDRSLDELSLYADGGSRGNPGDGAVAYIITDLKGRELRRGQKSIGLCTNNVAEYEAIKYGLNEALLITRGKVNCYSDSSLIINQLNGEWRINVSKLRALCTEVKEIASLFDCVTFNHLHRENEIIVEVDKLVNAVLGEKI